LSLRLSMIHNLRLGQSNDSGAIFFRAVRSVNHP
jgi:hypothetical protein